MSEEHNNSKQRSNLKNKKSSNPNKSPSKQKRKKKKKKKLGFKIAMTFLFLVVLLLAIGGTILVNSLGKMEKLELDKSNLGITSHEELKKYEGYDQIKNIALFGIDSENGLEGRSDAIMIATIDPVHDKIKLTSLMRDTYVYIDGYGYDKLNHAYAYGGPELAIKTINENFGLNIEDFASVNFMSLPKVINALGGVEISVGLEEYPYVNSITTNINNDYGFDSPLIDHVGPQILNGVQALAYSRIRSTDGGDFERTQRQRTVMEAIFEKAKSTSIASYPSILNKVMSLIQTNMSTNDILAMGTRVITMGGGSLEQQRFPLDEYSWGDEVPDSTGLDIWYLMYDEEITKQQITDYIFDDVLPTVEEGTEYESEYESESYYDSPDGQ